MAYRVMLAAAVILTLLASAPSGWNTKATPNERAASTAVGGFNALNAHLYHEGLQHLYHTHQRVGGFTIGQVVEQERMRESGRGKLPALDDGTTSAVGVVLTVIFVLLAIGGGITYTVLRRARGVAGSYSVAPPPPIDTSFSDGPLTPVHPGNVIPHKGETFYWAVSAEALGLVHHKEYVRGNAGMSFRVMRGVYAHTGGSRGHAVDNVTFGVIDRGRLLFSNVRLLFIGTAGTAYAGYQSIIAVDPFVDGFRVVVDRINPMVFHTGSQREAVVLRRLIAGDTADHRGAAKMAPTNLEARAATTPERAAEILARVDRDRVTLAQQKASQTMSEGDYVKAMRELDEIAAKAAEWTTSPTPPDQSNR